MASKPPAHGSSAQTTEIDIDLVAEGIGSPDEPDTATAVVSVDANSTLCVEISADDRDDWTIDARVVTGDLEVRHAFRDGRGIDGAVPGWVMQVLEVVGDRLEGGRV